MADSSPKDSSSKASSPLSTFRDPAQATLGDRASGILRRRREAASPFSAAGKALASVMELTRKVRFDNIANTLQEVIAGDKKRNVAALPSPAPMGVTHAYSVLLTHVAAPLWTVESPSVGVNAPISFVDSATIAFARTLDSKGWEIESVHEILNSDMRCASVYICLLIAKLLCLENQEWRLSFVELAHQIARDVKHKGDYQEQNNDEISTPDMPRRKLSEVGGAWRPRGAIELAPALAQQRQLCMVRCMHASVCFRYFYTDENVQALVDALASQLFLVNYNESVVQLVAGVKGEAYVAKYLVHVSRAVSDPLDADSALCDAEVRTPVLEIVTAATELALSNLIHRNDTGALLLRAVSKALAMCPPRQLRSLIQMVHEILSLVNCADLGCLASLLDAVRPLVLLPNPVGKDAFKLMGAIWMGLRNVGSNSRLLMQSLLVGGEALWSFRKRPIHAIVTPYAARSFILTRISHADIPMQRGVNPMLPVALPAHIDPATGVPVVPAMLEDTILYLANHTSNVVQQTIELLHHEAETVRMQLEADARDADLRGRDRTVSTTSNASAGTNGSNSSGSPLVDALRKLPAEFEDLRFFFGIHPMHLCVPMTVLHLLLHPSKQVIFSDPAHTKPETFDKIADEYAKLMGNCKQSHDNRRFRLESPRPPLRPILLAPWSDRVDVNTMAYVFETHWKYTDGRITDVEPAYLHPKRDTSVFQYIGNEPVDLLVVGGTGTIRRICEELARLHCTHPGKIVPTRLFPLPAGYDNDIPAWLARCDPLYNQRIFAPFACLPTLAMDSVNSEQLMNPPVPNLESLLLRNAVAHYVNHAKAENHLLLFEVECRCADGSTKYIVMCSNFEVGAHVTAAVIRDGFTCSKDALATETFIRNEDALRAADSTRISMRRTKSVVGPRGMAASGAESAAVDGRSPITFTADQSKRLLTLADTMVRIFSVAQVVSLSDTSGNTGSEVEVSDRLESADRLLARMHSSFRGVPLATRRHPIEPRDVPFCCSGTDILDWISTAYPIFNPKVAASIAQRMLEKTIINTAAVMTGKTADKFSETNLYTLRPREESDTVPLAVASQRSHTFDLAMSMREAVQEAPIPSRATTNVSFLMKARVHFVPRRGDPQYGELSSLAGSASAAPPQQSAMMHGHGEAPPAPSNVPQTTADVLRDIVTLKFKSCGAAGDKGNLPSPCEFAAQLTIHDAERKRFAAANQAGAAPGAPGMTAPGGASAGSAGAGGSASGSGATGNAAGTAGSASAAAGGPAPAVRPSNTGMSPDTGDYYTIRFGSNGKLEPTCVLSIEIRDDGVVSAAGLGTSNGLHGVHCCIDGEVYGPFTNFRIRPISRPESKDLPLTQCVMSYLACGDS